jgi:two-component system sensor histidine kinase KdpD
MRLNRHWMPLQEVVGTTLASLEEVLAGRDLRVDLPPDLPLVQLDAVLIERVLVNLLENAAKYTPPATPIRIAARAVGRHLEIDVADAGPGVPARPGAGGGGGRSGRPGRPASPAVRQIRAW